VYPANPQLTAVYRFYESVKGTRVFQAKIEHLPSYSGKYKEYKPSNWPPASSDQMLTQLLAIDRARAELCGKISSNSIVLLRTATMALRDYCFFSVAQNAHKPWLCRKMAPQDQSGGRWPGQNGCEEQASQGESGIEYGPHRFSTRKGFVEALQGLGYENPSLPSREPDWIKFFLARKSPPDTERFPGASPKVAFV
jgi:hypothetical protein